MNLSTRLTLAMVTLVLATSAAVGLLGYYSAEAVLVPGAWSAWRRASGRGRQTSILT
jgi:hypothetical protein